RRGHRHRQRAAARPGGGGPRRARAPPPRHRPRARGPPPPWPAARLRPRGERHPRRRRPPAGRRGAGAGLAGPAGDQRPLHAHPHRIRRAAAQPGAAGAVALRRQPTEAGDGPRAHRRAEAAPRRTADARRRHRRHRVHPPSPGRDARQGVRHPAGLLGARGGDGALRPPVGDSRRQDRRRGGPRAVERGADRAADDRRRGGMSGKKAWRELAFPLAAVAAAFVVGGLLVLAVGDHPLLTYELLIGSALTWPDGIGYTLFYATPLIFTGLAVAVAFRCGLLNIGAEGQLTIAAFATAWVGIELANLPAAVLLPLCFLTAILAGGV